MSTQYDAEMKEKTNLHPPYNVVLLDDDAHTFEYVIEMLTKVFQYDLPKCIKMTLEVHEAGRVIVWTGPLEHAEFKRDQIHSCGKDLRVPHCKGSMTAVLEPNE